MSMRRRKRPGLVVVALCLGGALTACGAGDDGDGYAAVGAGAGQKGAVPPSGSVTLVPLDPADPGLTSSTSRPSPRPTTGDRDGGDRDSDPGGTAPRPPGPGGGTATAPPPASGGTTPPRTPGSPANPADPHPTGPPRPGTTTPAPGPPSTTPPPTRPPAPAQLTLSAPVLTDTDRRWCENVTVTFRNTGGTAARSGTVTFTTHVIGALGVHWATLTSSQPLPAPIEAGTTRTQTYRVCVDSWRVPIGMRVDTRKVTAAWQ
ncbi:hypothetical protein ABZ135_16720 [Streptomyces sp. NPDC006339]|uniref:hypothetical protein n=1 Tax=Streptomyces sp. NPDC006339 TaxID=3156755 RepID=UPI0033B7AF73